MPPRQNGTKPAAALSSSAQLHLSSRARYDPRRRCGNGNAVASGIDLSRVGIISDVELNAIRRLVSAESEDAELRSRRQAEEQRRREWCKSRTAGWPDTIEAKRDLFLRSRDDAKKAAEERQLVMDALYAEQEEQARLASLAKLELQELKDDPRGRNLRSMLLLNDALKTREEQVAYRKMQREQEASTDAVELREMQMKAWGDEAEELHRKLAARQRNVEEKNYNLETVMYQIDERISQRAGEKAERVHVDREALEERQEQAEEDAQRHRLDLENAAFNQEHRRRASTKAERLKERMRQNVTDEADRLQEEAKVDSLKQFVLDHQRKKQEDFEKRKVKATSRYLAEVSQGSPTVRTQDAFETKGRSFLDRMYDGDVERVDKQRTAVLEALREDKEAKENGTGVYSCHRAAATAAGFMDAAEEREHLDEMRTYPARVRAEELKEANERRAEALRIEKIQRLQAEEKRENARIEVEGRREAARQQKLYSEADDARYRQYIDSLVPKDMNPILYKKAMEFQ